MPGFHRPGSREAVVPKQYKIADACRLLDIQPYVLRYWQTEFRALAPKKDGGRRGDFSAGDLETIRRIKELLYDEGYTIASAKKKIAAELEDGRLRGRPLMPGGEDEPEGGAPAEEAEKPETKAGGEAPAGAPEVKADAEAPVEENPPAGAGAQGALTRRVEELEEGVAAVAAQARQLAAALATEGGAEGD